MPEINSLNLYSCEFLAHHITSVIIYSPTSFLIFSLLSFKNSPAFSMISFICWICCQIPIGIEVCSWQASVCNLLLATLSEAHWFLNLLNPSLELINSSSFLYISLECLFLISIRFLLLPRVSFTILLVNNLFCLFSSLSSLTSDFLFSNILPPFHLITLSTIREIKSVLPGCLPELSFIPDI